MALIWERGEEPIRYHATGEEEVQLLAMIRTMRQVVEEAGPAFVYQKVVDHAVTSNYALLDGAQYTACVYVRDGKPDCLGARVLARMGVPLETLSSIEGKWATDLSDKPGNTLLKPTLRLIAEAQGLQDSGTPWGAVLQHIQEKLQTRYGVQA